MNIIVNVRGGLGNQMFQYAFAYGVSKKINQPFELDISDFDTYWHPYKPNTYWNLYQLDAFKMEARLTSHKTKPKKRNLVNRTVKILKIIKRKFLTKNYYQEPHYHFDKNVFTVKNNTYFMGYWQSEDYFKEYREELLKEFALKAPLQEKSQQYKKDILSNNAVSLHIRRGDYLTGVGSNFYNIYDLGYYQKAVKHITQHIPEVCFYIFSDDLAWVKDNLAFIKNKIFIESDKNIPDYEEMYLMSLCKHNIIANSSFSWWGAWLNQNNEKIVIAPQKWCNDSLHDTINLIPNDWIKL